VWRNLVKKSKTACVLWSRRATAQQAAVVLLPHTAVLPHRRAAAAAAILANCKLKSTILYP